MGTAGQRCTSLRRLIVHENVYDKLLPRLKQVYGSVAVGDPRESGTLVGPLINRACVSKSLQEESGRSESEAGVKITGGDRVDVSGCEERILRAAGASRR